MIYPHYVEGTSFFCYYNQILGVNAVNGTILFGPNKYAVRRKPVYIPGLLINAKTNMINSMIIKEIPDDIYDSLNNHAAMACGPFSPKSIHVMKALFDDELKYCPECIKKGLHYYYQQLKFENRCHKHNLLLEKGCPFCGKPVPYILEIDNLDSFTCPSCRIRYTDQMYVNELFLGTYHNDIHNICYSSLKGVENGYIAVSKGAESILNGKKLYSFLDQLYSSDTFKGSGIQTSTQKSQNCSLMDFLRPYADVGHNDLNVAEIKNYIVMNQDNFSDPEKRASACICRMFVSGFNLRRFDIPSIHTIISDVRKSIISAGINNDVESITDVIVRQCLETRFKRLVKLFRIHNKEIFHLILSYNDLPDAAFVSVILKKKGGYLIRMFF